MKKNQIRFLCLFLCICLSCAGLVPGIGGSRAGAEATGRWIETKDGWMYLEGNTVTTGWKQIGDSWYWFDASGMMAEGWLEIDGAWYYFEDGKMATGTRKIDGKEYTFATNGVWQQEAAAQALQAGWQETDSGWIYMTDQGTAATGWLQLDDLWYYFDESGVMQTGWLQLDDTWYYLAPDGAMATGRQEIDGEWYEFSSDGAWLEDGRVLSLLDVPWGATYKEVESALPEGLELSRGGNSLRNWYTADGFLSTGGSFSHEELGFMAFAETRSGDDRLVYCGHQVQSITYYFLYAFDENGNLVCDTDHSALICAWLQFMDTDDESNQVYEDILRQLTEEYGAPVDHQEYKNLFDRITMWDFWNGAEGSRMALERDGYGNVGIKYTWGEMDRMLNDVNDALSSELYSEPGYGFSDGTPLKFEKFSLSPDPGLYYEIPEEEDDLFINALVYLLPDYSGDVWYGDDIVAFNWTLFSSVQDIYDWISIDIDNAYTRTPEYDIFPETGTDSVFCGKNCTVYDAECAFTDPEEDNVELYSYFIRVFVFPSPLSCAFSVCSFNYNDLDVLAGQLEDMLTWK